MIRLKKLRMEARLSQAEFAKIMRVAQNTVSNWENGNRLLDSENINRICDYFGCSSDYLLGRTDDPRLEIKKAPPESGAEEFERPMNAPDKLTPEEIKAVRAFLVRLDKPILI